MSRCYACCQENCSNLKPACTCTCHRDAKSAKKAAKKKVVKPKLSPSDRLWLEILKDYQIKKLTDENLVKFLGDRGFPDRIVNEILAARWPPRTKKAKSSPVRQHMKAVVWPRGRRKQGKGKPDVFRYVILGMIVSTHPIPEWEGKNELVLDGVLDGVGAISRIRTRKPARRLGDASDVLTSLDMI